MKSRNAKGVSSFAWARRNWIRFAALASMNKTLPVARSASSAKVRADELPASQTLRSSLVRSCKASSKSDKVHLRSEEHTSELQSLMRISYAVFCLKQKKKQKHKTHLNI